MSGSAWSNDQPRTLVVPPGAAAGAAQVDIDDTLPALLAAFYSGTASAVSIRMYPGDGSYHYIATGLQGDGSTFMAMGIVPASATVMSDLCQTWYQFFLPSTDVAQAEIGDSGHDFRLIVNANFTHIGANGTAGALLVSGATEFEKNVTLDSTGTFFCNGPAVFAEDVKIGPGVTAISQSSINWSTNGTAADGWTGITFANGWTNLAGGMAGSFKLVASPPNGLWLVGNLVPGTKVNGTVIGTLPVGFRPSHTIGVPLTADVQAAGQSPHLNIDSGGVMTCFGVATATQVAVCSVIPLDL